MQKSFVFTGEKNYSVKEVQETLGLNPRPVGSGNAVNPRALQPGYSRFLQPVQECEFQLTNIIEQLKRDMWPVPASTRQSRCTGSAMSIAVSLMEQSFAGTGGRIMLFAAGPPTVGPGLVVSTELKEPIRSHNDIEHDSAPHYKNAIKFYDGLAKRAATNGHAIDLCVGCYDQVGIQEMKSMTDSTGGVMILTDAFTTSIFKQSVQRILPRMVMDF